MRGGCAGADEFYQRADERTRKGTACRSVELTTITPVSPTKLPKGRRVPEGQCAHTQCYHTPAPLPRRNGTLSESMRTGPCRTVCACCMYGMHTLYGYCMSMYWTLPMTVLYACVWQRVGPVGVAGYYPSTPLTGPCGPGISVWQRWPRDVAEPCMPAEGCGSRALLRFLR